MDNMPDEAKAELNGKFTWKMLGSCIALFVLGSLSFGETVKGDYPRGGVGIVGNLVSEWGTLEMSK
jgi:hypothetical protein